MIRSIVMPIRAARVAIAAALVFAACASAQAQNAAPTEAPGRYSFDRVGDVFMRLDTATGQVSVCNQRSVGWACQAVPEDRVALESEIARLQNAMAEMKAEIAALRAPPPRPPAELSPPENNGSAKLTLPTHEDLERARAAVTHAWRSLVDMIVGFKNDMMKKG